MARAKGSSAAGGSTLVQALGDIRPLEIPCAHGSAGLRAGLALLAALPSLHHRRDLALSMRLRRSRVL